MIMLNNIITQIANIKKLNKEFFRFSVLIVLTIILCALLQTFLGIFGTVLINSDVGRESVNGTISSSNSNSQIEQFFTKYILGSHSFVAALLDDTFWFQNYSDLIFNCKLIYLTKCRYVSFHKYDLFYYKLITKNTGINVSFR